jgi:phage gp36-like protein
VSNNSATQSPHDVGHADGATAVARLSRCSTIDDRAVELLDACVPPGRINDELLRTTPLSDLSSLIAQIVAMLRTIDVQQLLGKQLWYHRLIGADIEARLEFELASRNASSVMTQLHDKHVEAERLSQLIVRETEMIGEQQDQLEQAISVARALIRSSPSVDEYDKSRFERRLANMMALHVANGNTIKQFQMAHQTITIVIDRYRDVDKLLFPLWQRNVAAIAQSDGRLSHDDAAVTQLQQVQNQILESIQSGTSQ